MLNIFKLLTLSVFLVFSNAANAVHEPYVNDNFQGIVTSGPLTGSMVDIYIEGQTHNAWDGLTNNFSNEWSFSLDAGTVTFSDLTQFPTFNLLSDFQSLDLSVIQWRSWFDESEGLDSAYPEHLLINGVWAASSPFGSTPVTISTVPVPSALFLFISGLVGFAGYIKSHNKFSKQNS